MCIHAGAWFSFCLSARVLNSNLNLSSNSFDLRGKRKEERNQKKKRGKQPNTLTNPTRSGPHQLSPKSSLHPKPAQQPSWPAQPFPPLSLPRTNQHPLTAQLPLLLSASANATAQLSLCAHSRPHHALAPQTD